MFKGFLKFSDFLYARHRTGIADARYTEDLRTE